MPRYLVTQSWVVEGPDPDYVRDLVLNTRPDAEQIEEINDQH